MSKRSLAMILGVAAAAVIAATQLGAGPVPIDQLSARVGRDCKVQLRRDLLGAASNLPVSVFSDAVQGLAVSIIGELAAVNDSWIVLKTTRRESTEARVNIRKDEIWIPRDAVLLVQFDAQ